MPKNSTRKQLTHAWLRVEMNEYAAVGMTFLTASPDTLHFGEFGRAIGQSFGDGRDDSAEWWQRPVETKRESHRKSERGPARWRAGQDTWAEELANKAG